VTVVPVTSVIVSASPVMVAARDAYDADR